MDNGENEEKVKFCPFLNEYCKKERCALYTEMMRQTGAAQQKFGMCSFNAMVMVLSEMNVKATPQQKIQLPHIFRG